MHILGIDIGGTKTAVVAGDRRGNILQREQFATEAARGFSDCYARIRESMARVVLSVQGPPRAVSVSVGGPLDVLKGIVKSPPNLPGWVDIPLKEMLARDFRVPVFVEHDGNAGALAEWYFGAGKGFRNIVFVTMGTGFGAGLILDGLAGAAGTRVFSVDASGNLKLKGKITFADSSTLGSGMPACSKGQSLLWSGTAWGCSTACCSRRRRPSTRRPGRACGSRPGAPPGAQRGLSPHRSHRRRRWRLPRTTSSSRAFSAAPSAGQFRSGWSGPSSTSP